MPTSGEISYHRADGQPNFFDPTPVGVPTMYRPFQYTPSARVWTQEMECHRDGYMDAPLDSLCPWDPEAYCVGDMPDSFKPEDFGPNLKFTREYASIPPSRKTAIGSFFYDFPGLPAEAIGTAKTYTPATFAPSLGIWSPVLNCTGHGYAFGDTVAVYVKAEYIYTYGTPWGGYTTVTGSVEATYYVRVIEVVSANQFKTQDITLDSESHQAVPIWTFIAGNVRKGLPGRNRKSIAGSAIEVMDYALPGVTPGIANALDFTPLELFKVVDLISGFETDTITETNSVPTSAQYRAMIDNKQTLCVESSVSIYKGNILQRRTILVRAM